MLGRSEALSKTQNGLTLFELLVPGLKIINGRNITNVDSPISGGKNCFSVFESKGRYLYKDHFTGQVGDIFQLIGLMNHLDSRGDFPKILQLIEKMLHITSNTIPESEKVNYIDSKTKDVLSLASGRFSRAFVESYFMIRMSHLDSAPSYKVHLVLSFEMKNKQIGYRFDMSKPSEAYYAFALKDDQFYLLYNPLTRAWYEWGQEPEYFQFGKDNLLQTAYSKNIYLRDSLVLTNTVDGLLWCEDKGIPCLAILNDKLELPKYIQDVVLTKFEHRYLLFELTGFSRKQIRNFISNNGFINIITGSDYLHEFFSGADKAVETIFSQLHHSDGYEYNGLKNRIHRSGQGEV